ncbi:MAG: VWA domain-containing protein [Bdellovibrionota bacterium]
MIQFKLIKNQWALSIASIMRFSIRDKCNFLILPAYIFIISCQQANFSNASPKQKENDVIAEKENLSSEQNANNGDIKSINTLSFSCDDLSTGTATIEKDKLLNKVRIGGELCLAPKKDNEDSNVNILFVIDLSGSMKVNDQFKNDTCGRYNAVNAILDQIVSLNTAMFGIIGFSNQATTISPINKVSSDINIDPQQLCGSEGATSYGNALNRAYELLKDKSGKK